MKMKGVPLEDVSLIHLSDEDRCLLLQLARQAIDTQLRRLPLPELALSTFSEVLRQPGASFVTLTRADMLRGCVGTLEAYQPLAEDVREHALAAAFQDHRFPPLQFDELAQIKIEISRLTAPHDLTYDTPEELLGMIRPKVDGVTLIDGARRATFLPQVWEKLPDRTDFLEHLCSKMGGPPDLWRKRKLRVQIYQVEEFHE
jgi:AmmeMemoRadiSam system protein A